MYYGGCGLGLYVGETEEDRPWWEKLLSAGERILTREPTTGQVWPEYPPLPAPTPIGYPGPAPAGLPAPTMDFTAMMPWLLLGGIALFVLSRRR